MCFSAAILISLFQAPFASGHGTWLASLWRERKKRKKRRWGQREKNSTVYSPYLENKLTNNQHEEMRGLEWWKLCVWNLPRVMQTWNVDFIFYIQFFGRCRPHPLPRSLTHLETAASGGAAALRCRQAGGVVFFPPSHTPHPHLHPARPQRFHSNNPRSRIRGCKTCMSSCWRHEEG